MRKRKNRIDIYLSDEEKEILNKKSKEENLTHSDIIRHMLKNTKHSFSAEELNDIINSLIKVKDYQEKLNCYQASTFLNNTISKMKKE